MRHQKTKITIAISLIALGGLADSVFAQRFIRRPATQQQQQVSRPGTGNQRPVTEREDADTQWQVGLRYHTGEGVPQNLTEAVRWYRKAAERGLADAQHSLAVCYAEGLGVPKNLAEAIRWFRRAAQQGHANAQLNLGRAYARGIGVRQDRAEAMRWTRLAAEQGWPDAQDELNTLLQGSGGQAAQQQTASHLVLSNWKQVDRHAQTIVQRALGFDSISDVRVLQYRVANDGWYIIRYQFRSFNNRFSPTEEGVFRVNRDGSVDQID